MSTRTLSPSVNQLGHEANHLTLSIAEVKNEWRYTSTSLHTFTVWGLIKYMDMCTYSSYYTKAVDITDDSKTALKITNTLPFTIFISRPRTNNFSSFTIHRSPYFHIPHCLWLLKEQQLECYQLLLAWCMSQPLHPACSCSWPNFPSTFLYNQHTFFLLTTSAIPEPNSVSLKTEAVLSSKTQSKPTWYGINNHTTAIKGK